MKTDDLIGMLATGVEPVPRRATTRRLVWALAAGLPLAVAIMLAGYGIRRDLVQAMFWPMLWVKILFPFFMAWGGFLMTQRLARPGVRVGLSWLLVAVPLLLVWGMALQAWFTEPAAERMPMLMGQTWRTCAASIALISAPLFIAGLVALKGLAPTRPAWAGAAVGALAGGAGATVYALHCPELAAPFLAVWYVAGVLIPVVLGAVLGPRLLRW
ncbi:MAG: DUF1109 domain-containing protein [Proteobacteria bacterium]|nr:DUF1109 domain-containing protein [Pseudomonadota bacterium]